MRKLGRNDKCYCGSEKKYKRCCLQLDQDNNITRLVPNVNDEDMRGIDEIGNIIDVGHDVAIDPEQVNDDIDRFLEQLNYDEVVASVFEEFDWDHYTYQMVATQFLNYTKERYLPFQLFTIIKLWNDFTGETFPIIRKLNVFVASLEYYMGTIFGYEVTQKELSEKYGVSASTISQRYGDIYDFVEVNYLDDELYDFEEAEHLSVDFNPGFMMEQGMIKLLEKIEKQNFESHEELDAFLNEELKSFGFDSTPNENLTDKERASDLLYEAWEEPNTKRKINLAKQALKLYPNSPDAYNILAEFEAKSAAQAAELYKQGMLAGEQDFGKDYFDQHRGYFWGYTPTRPYMRSKLGYAQVCAAMGNKAEAIQHYTELLILNPNDNQGVRELLLWEYLAIEAWDKAVELINQYEEDASATFNYNRLLVSYGQHGITEELHELLETALEQNPHVIPYLIGRKKLPNEIPDYIGFGDETEAQTYVMMHQSFWLANTELKNWAVKNS